jgi:hypothetical protein
MSCSAYVRCSSGGTRQSMAKSTISPMEPARSSRGGESSTSVMVIPRIVGQRSRRARQASCSANRWSASSRSTSRSLEILRIR